MQHYQKSPWKFFSMSYWPLVSPWLKLHHGTMEFQWVLKHDFPGNWPRNCWTWPKRRAARGWLLPQMPGMERGTMTTHWGSPSNYGFAQRYLLELKDEGGWRSPNCARFIATLVKSAKAVLPMPKGPRLGPAMAGAEPSHGKLRLVGGVTGTWWRFLKIGWWREQKLQDTQDPLCLRGNSMASCTFSLPTQWCLDLLGAYLGGGYSCWSNYAPVPKI